MKKYVGWVVVVLVILAAIIAGYFTYPMWGPMAPSFFQWLGALLLAQNLSLFLPGIAIVLIALVEFVFALILRQRHQVFASEREVAAVLHQKEMALLRQEVELVSEEKARIQAQLVVRDEMVQQERALLLSRLERLQRDAGISLGLVVAVSGPRLTSRIVSNAEQVLNRLERIELTMDAAHETPQDDGSDVAVRAANWLRLGNAYYYIGLPLKAMSYYERVQALQPQDVVGYVNSGFSLLAQDSIQQAIEAFDRATRIDGNSPYAYHGRGVAYERLGRERRALEDYNKAIPAARGEAERTIKAAEGYALDRVNRAEGDAARFIAFYNEYAKAKDVTKRRMYLETLKDLFPRLGKKYIIDSDQKNLLPLLNLGSQDGEQK